MRLNVQYKEKNGCPLKRGKIIKIVLHEAIVDAHHKHEEQREHQLHCEFRI